LLFIPFLVYLEKDFKMILHAPVIIGRLRIPGMVNDNVSGYDFSALNCSRVCELSRMDLGRPRAHYDNQAKGRTYMQVPPQEQRAAD
jgi:hypothetical protein